MSTLQTQKNRAIRVALTGGIGSGKTTALAMFCARDAAVLNSDHIVHQLLQRRDIRQRISARLNIPMFAAGDSGRRQLADVVFADEDKLDQLQKIMFPLVKKAVEHWFESTEVLSAGLAVVELPMLFEADMQTLFDRVILVTAPAAQRRQRQSGRMAQGEFRRRSAQQLPETEKRARADMVYDNTGSPEELDDFVAATVTALAGPESRTGAKPDTAGSSKISARKNSEPESRPGAKPGMAGNPEKNSRLGGDNSK